MFTLHTNLYKQAQSEPVDPGLTNDSPKPGMIDMFLNYSGANPVGKNTGIKKLKRKNWKKDPKTIVIER